MIRAVRRSLVLQLALPLTATLLASFTVATAISVLVGRRAINDQMTDSLRSEGLVVLSQVRTYLNQRLAEIELWAGDAAMDDVLIDDRDLRVQNYLLRLQRAFPNHYGELSVITASDTVLASTQQARIGFPLDLRVFDLQPVDRSTARWGGVVTRAGGERALVIVHPIKSRLRSDTIGTLVAAIAWTPIEQTMGPHGHDADSHQPGAFGVLLDRSGQIIAGGDRLSSMPPEVQAAFRQPGRLMRASDGGNRYVLMAVAASDAESRVGRQFSAVAFRAEGAAYWVMGIFVSSVIAAALVGMVLAGATSFLFARAASRRLDLLMDTTRRIAKGDLSHRVRALGDDELGELASCFNDMTDELATARNGLEQLVESRTAALRERTAAFEVSEARTGAIVASSLDGIITFNAEARIEEFNRAAEQIFGLSRQDALRLFVTDLIVPPSFVADEKAFLRYLKTEDHTIIGRRYETFGRRPSDGQFRLELTVTRINAGNASLFTAFVRDITEQKRVEHQLKSAKVAAEEAVRVKSEFLANMSHEIRTPMNGILGIAELLVRTELTQEQSEYAALLESSAQALLLVINDILDLSKIEAGKLRLECVPFDPRAEVEGVMDLLALRAHTKGVELLTVIASSVPMCVFGDAGRVRQVLLNLAGNAVKYTSSGEVVIHLSARRDELEFEIADSGVGIGRDALDRLFKPFSQIDAPPMHRHGGTGLGLAISKQLVEAMGGRITVRSQEGRGAQFFVSLPIDTQVAADDDRVPGALGRHALVGSGHAATRSIVRLYLEAFGFDVDEADDVAGTWRRMSAASGPAYAVAVLDLTLPGLALERERVQSAPPLILLTRVVDQREGSAVPRRCDQLLTKPIKRVPLRAATVAALGARIPAVADRATPSLLTIVPPPAPVITRGRLLLVEDNEFSQQVALHLLKTTRFDCDIAENGRLALEAIATTRYDVVLMDCRMPEMDGYEATDLLRRRDDGHRPIVIAMTAGAFDEDRERCLAAGMDDYISKPVTRDVLLAVLKKYLPEELFAQATIS